MLDRGELHLVQGDMGGVEIDRRDLRGLGHQIACHVASAGGDGDHMVCAVDAKGVHVDDRIFPYLGIHEVAEKVGEQALQGAFAREGLVMVNGDRELFAGGAVMAGDGIHGGRSFKRPSVWAPR